MMWKGSAINRAALAFTAGVVPSGHCGRVRLAGPLRRSASPSGLAMHGGTLPRRLAAHRPQRHARRVERKAGLALGSRLAFEMMGGFFPRRRFRAGAACPCAVMATMSAPTSAPAISSSATTTAAGWRLFIPGKDRKSAISSSPRMPNRSSSIHHPSERAGQIAVVDLAAARQG